MRLIENTKYTIMHYHGELQARQNGQARKNLRFRGIKKYLPSKIHQNRIIFCIHGKISLAVYFKVS